MNEYWFLFAVVLSVGVIVSVNSILAHPEEIRVKIQAWKVSVDWHVKDGKKMSRRPNNGQDDEKPDPPKAE